MAGYNETINESRWDQFLAWLQVGEDDSNFWADNDETSVFETQPEDDRGSIRIASYDFDSHIVTIYAGLVWQTFEEEHPE